MKRISNRDEALRFVEEQGIALESGAGPVASLAEAIAGSPIKGSWWSHPDGKTIFALTRAVRDSDDVLVCKAINGKITYVHKRLWPALVRLSERLGPVRLARVIEEHSYKGAHVLRTIAYPRWVPEQTKTEAERLGVAEAEQLLSGLLGREPN